MQMLRDALLSAVRGVLSAAALLGAAAILGRHIRERPRRGRTNQFDKARSHGCP
jgi:hypothetical protein